MSKERARRRAVREAEADRVRQAAARQQHRRRRRRATLQRLQPELPRRRRVARVWSRRSRTQRAGIFAVALAVVVLTFLLTDSWGIRVAVLGLAAIGTPALATIALDRSRG